MTLQLPLFAGRAGGSNFSASITRFVDGTKIKGDFVVRRLAFDAYRGVMVRSPVDTGRFRASWRVSMGSTNPTVEPARKKPKVKRTKTGKKAKDQSQPAHKLRGRPPGPGERALSGVDVVGSQARLGTTVYITNNLPYALKLEQGKHSKQARGEGAIMRRTFHELLAEFDATAKSITLGGGKGAGP